MIPNQEALKIRDLIIKPRCHIFTLIGLIHLDFVRHHGLILPLFVQHQIGVCVLSATTQSNQIHVLHEINVNNPNQTKPNQTKPIQNNLCGEGLELKSIYSVLPRCIASH